VRHMKRQSGHQRADCLPAAMPPELRVSCYAIKNRLAALKIGEMGIRSVLIRAQMSRSRLDTNWVRWLLGLTSTL
jgi:hypothetical protein